MVTVCFGYFFITHAHIHKHTRMFPGRVENAKLCPWMMKQWQLWKKRWFHPVWETNIELKSSFFLVLFLVTFFPLMNNECAFAGRRSKMVWGRSHKIHQRERDWQMSPIEWQREDERGRDQKSGSAKHESEILITSSTWSGNVDQS